MRARMLSLLGWHCSCGEDGAGASNGQEGCRSGPAALALGSRCQRLHPSGKEALKDNDAGVDFDPAPYLK
jgi:hypothetical protein